jgi:hypothetical protein
VLSLALSYRYIIKNRLIAFVGWNPLENYFQINFYCDPSIFTSSRGTDRFFTVSGVQFVYYESIKLELKTRPI